MSDHEYLCNLHRQDLLDEHELVEAVLSNDEKELRTTQDKVLLDAGRIVHLIWLTTSIPGKVIKAAINYQLSAPLEFRDYNYLMDTSWGEPGSWFVNKGFTVRSTKVEGHWLQCAFARTGPVNLTRSEIIEYLGEVAKMDFDSSKIDDHECIVITSNHHES